MAEHYLPRVDAERVEAVTQRLVAAADTLQRADLDVRVLGSAGVPGDASFLSLFTAPSLEAVARTVSRAEGQTGSSPCCGARGTTAVKRVAARATAFDAWRQRGCLTESPACGALSWWSGRRESNPHSQLGRLELCH